MDWTEYEVVAEPAQRAPFDALVARSARILQRLPRRFGGPVEVAGVACDERDQVPGTRQSRHVARSLQDGDGILRDAPIDRFADVEGDVRTA